nr:calmodulin-like protein 3 [Ipomoea batatas]
MASGRLYTGSCVLEERLQLLLMVGLTPKCPLARFVDSPSFRKCKVMGGSVLDCVGQFDSFSSEKEKPSPELFTKEESLTPEEMDPAELFVRVFLMFDRNGERKDHRTELSDSLEEAGTYTFPEKELIQMIEKVD